jgi:hypothetical protein
VAVLSKFFRKYFLKFYTTRCSIVGEIAPNSYLMFCFKSTVLLGFFRNNLLLSYPQRMKSQALRTGDLVERSIFPLREITRDGNIFWGLTLQSSQCESFPVFLKLESLVFNTKSLQIRFQKCAKHFSVANLINSYSSACFVFKGIGTDQNKNAPQHQAIKFSNCKGFW